MMIMHKIFLKAALINHRHPKLKYWIIAAIAGLLILVVGVSALYSNTSAQYYYVDLNGNRGVADSCWESRGQLICNRTYGGKIVVQQY